MTTTPVPSKAAALMPYFKGVAMGLADLVPGVSGGTIAMLTGIYERLINAISSIRPGLIAVLRTRGLMGLWQEVDATFVLSVLAGIITSIFTFSHLVSWAMVEAPVPFWALFCGLVMASVVLVGRRFRWSWLSIPLLAAGVLLVVGISGQMAPVTDPSLARVFISGAIAICAMILPGISGSLLLVTMGMYAPVLAAVKGFDLPIILVFATGCLTGLLCAARLIRWLLSRWHDGIMAFLTGLMLGSLVKIWPWRAQVQGEGLEVLHSPQAWSAITGQPADVLLAVLFCIGAVMLVLGIEALATRSQD